MIDELQHNLDSLKRDECYRVDCVLKTREFERTERVFFVGANGSELGPFVRKTFRQADGIGSAWSCVFSSQQKGTRFAHLPRIIDCYEAGEDCVVVMEFVAGKTFDDIVYARGASLELALELFSDACDAVTELHEGFSPALIHRDIKPSNLMCSAGTVVLIDLGIARLFSSEASVDTVKFGTRGFAPPEQFGFGQTDERSDVYALGMLLFYLIVGQIPDSTDVARLLRARKVPERICDVVIAATAFDPASRYSSASALKRDFEQACAACKLVVAPVGYQDDSPSVLESGKAFATLFSRAGVVWDVVLAGASLLLLLTCFVGCLFPAGDAASTPFIPRAIQYLSIWLLLSAPALALCDPRPLRTMLPRFAACSFAKRLLFTFIVAAIAVCSVGIIDGITGTMGN